MTLILILKNGLLNIGKSDAAKGRKLELTSKYLKNFKTKNFKKKKI